MSEKTIYDTIVIGAGPAGMTAAVYAARANLKVLLLDRGAPGGKMLETGEIENYTGFEHVSGMELSQKMFAHVSKYDVKYDYGNVSTVKDLGTTKVVETDNGNFEGKTIIIATGNINRKLNVPGEQEFSGRGISWCAICDGAFFKGLDVVVIGGGNSAVEEAISLSNIAKKVTVLVRKDKLIAEKILQDKLLNIENVDIKYNVNVEEFQGENGKLQSVKLKHTNGDRSTINTNGAFELIGLTPASEPFKELGITDDRGYILVDESMSTKVKGIFSAGDVNQKHVRQIVTATADGAIAAQSALKYIEHLEG